MSSRGFFLLIAALALLSVGADAAFKSRRGSPLKFKQSIGQATNCGKVPFNVTWTPKELHPSDSVTIHISYQIPHDFSGGFLNANISFHGDKEPFMGFANKVTCDDIKKYMPFCPIKKGLFVNKSFPIRDLRSIASYTGTYDGIASLTNQDGLEMFCIKVTVTLDQ